MSAPDPTTERLAGRFGASLSCGQAGGRTSVIAGKEVLRDLLLFLKTDELLGYTMLTDLFVVDRHGSDPRFDRYMYRPAATVKIITNCHR